MRKAIGVIDFVHRKLRARGEAGATLVEYGIMIGLIAIACFAVIGALGINISGFFSAIDAAIR